MGSACTAEKAARNATIKSAADGESLRRDDFMVTNYIDGTIRKKGSRPHAQRRQRRRRITKELTTLVFLLSMAIGGHGHAPPFNLRRHRVETTLHLAGSGWSDCTSVWCDVFLFSLSNPDWIIFCSSYVTLLWAWTPWGLTTTLNQTPFVRFSTPVVQPMDGPHSHTQISPQAPSQVGVSASVRCLSSQNSWTTLPPL